MVGAEREWGGEGGVFTCRKGGASTTVKKIKRSREVGKCGFFDRSSFLVVVAASSLPFFTFRFYG